MSGGHFDYKQHAIREIYEEIEECFLKNKNFYKYHTMAEMNQAIYYLKIAYVYAQRVDWLLSGDDSEEAFLQRVESELKQFNLERDYDRY